MEDGRIGATEYAGWNGTRNTLEGTGHGKGAENAERNEERGEMRNIYRRGERLGLSLCAVPSPRRI